MARIYPDVAQLAPEDMKLLCDTFQQTLEEVATDYRLPARKSFITVEKV